MMNPVNNIRCSYNPGSVVTWVQKLRKKREGGSEIKRRGKAQNVKLEMEPAGFSSEVLLFLHRKKLLLLRSRDVPVRYQSNVGRSSAPRQQRLPYAPNMPSFPSFNYTQIHLIGNIFKGIFHPSVESSLLSFSPELEKREKAFSKQLSNSPDLEAVCWL